MNFTNKYKAGTKLLPALCFLLFCFSNSNAQQASSDSLKRHSPTKAIIFSAIVPGAGQVYNKKYWKVPIIYAGLGALIYSIDFNSKKYDTFKDAYIARTDTSALTTDDYPRYTADNLRSLFQYYRRNRDLSYILTGVVYVLNVLDAYVDAELFYFDVSDNLSLISTPFIMTSRQGNTIGGISLTLSF
jgi:Family of unknown function (DUF5683)